MKPSPTLSAYILTVRKIEKERGTRIWSMVHPGSWHICGPTAHSLMMDRDKIGRGEVLEIVLHSPGGHPNIAYSAMKLFRPRFKQVNVLIPLAAKSAATLMCLGADKIFMGEFAELGPIDVQINDEVERGAKAFSPLDEFKSLEFIREQAVQWMDYYARVMNKMYGLSFKEALKDSLPLVTGMMKPMLERIDPLEMGGHRRALAIGEEYAHRILGMVVKNDDVRESIVRRLVWEYPSHDFTIDADEAKKIGLPVEPLPETQDRELSSALMGLDDGDGYHGFATEENKGKSDKVQADRAAVKPTGKVNGRGTNGSGERRQSPRSAS